MPDQARGPGDRASHGLGMHHPSLAASHSRPLRCLCDRLGVGRLRLSWKIAGTLPLTVVSVSCAACVAELHQDDDARVTRLGEGLPPHGSAMRQDMDVI